MIFFQEINNKDIEIAKAFHCNYMGTTENVGILKGFITLIEKCNTEYFIFCENDWMLIENKIVVEKTLNDCLTILNNNIADIVRLRHKKNPGKPLYSKPDNIKKWIKNDIINFKYKLESLSWVDDPEKLYGKALTSFTQNYKWHITSLRHQIWSNNIFIAKTDFLKKIVVPLISDFKNKTDKYTGLEDVLINYEKYVGLDNNLDTKIVNFKNIKMAGGNGLFTHKDSIDIKNILYIFNDI